MDADNKGGQRRQDIIERLRIRFSQYHKRHTEYLTRYVNNGPVKEERERQDTQLYQQRILNTRANSKPRPKQEQTAKNSVNEQAYSSNAMGDTMILQQLKRRFDETFNQAQEGEDFEDHGPNKAARSEEEQRTDLPPYQQGNIMNNIRTMQVKPDLNDLSLGQTIPQAKQVEENVGSAITQRGQEQGGEVVDGPPVVDNLTKDHNIKDSTQIVTSNCHNTQKPSIVTAAPSSESIVLNENNTQFTKSANSRGSELQNGVSHIPNDGNLPDIILKDWGNDFEDMLQNISDNSSSTVAGTITSSTAKTTSAQTKSREKKETKNSNNNMLSPPSSRGNDFAMNSNLPQVSSIGNAPPYHNSIGGMQMRPQLPSPMSLGPIRRHLVDHIQGRGRQQVGPAPYAAMGGLPMRDSLVPGSQTKNPEIMAKVQEHLLLKKQIQQRQHMELVRQQQLQQQMQQPYQQQQTYQQQLMQMAQAAQQQQQQPNPSPMSPMMQSMSPHLQQQAFMQQSMTSPVPSPMSTTPHLNRNPFQFPHDFNAYVNQHKQMQGFETMGGMQSPHDGGSQMPMNYYQSPQQESPHFSMRQQMTTQGNMRPTGMQSATMRAMLARERMLSNEPIPQGQMMQGPIGPANFQPQAPKPPPPQYTQNNFSPPNIPLERPQLQRSLSHPRNRLSHFSHPDELQSVNPQTNVSLKSPGSLPMYPSGENGMYPMAGTVSSITNGGQPNSNPPNVRISDNNFSNFQNYGPPNMNLSNAMNARTSMSPNTWGHESHLQKQQTLQQIRMNMSQDYRIASQKGPSVNLSRSNSIGQSRHNPAQFNAMEKLPSEIPTMSSNSMIQLQTGPKSSPMTSLKQEAQIQDTQIMAQVNTVSDDLESILSDPPENFDLVKNLLG